MRTALVIFSFLLAIASGSSSAIAAGNDGVTVTANGITYVTRAGDTLSGIAQRLTTKRDNWIQLSKLNNIGSDVNVPVGTPITIPTELLIDDPSEAKVVAITGNISAVAPEGKPVLLQLGAKITEGMQIDTGSNSFLTLALPDLSRISLPSNSRIRIAKLRNARYTNSPRTEILLMRGRVESRVSPLELNKGQFDIRTPQAVAGVRGTNFRVGIDESGATVTEVLSGRVEVAKPGKAPGQLLHAGEGNVTDARGPGKPVTLLPTPQLAETPARASPAAAQFALTPIPGAAAYHVQIATDQEAHNILLEQRSSTTRLKLDGLPNGDYYARVSAIDRLGLEGPASIHAFSLTAAQAARDLGTPDAPFVDRNDTTQLTLKWKAAPGQKYNLQVSRDASFSWLIYSGKTDAPEVRLPRPAFGTYYARVQTVRADGVASPYSLAQPFIVTDQWIIHDGNPISSKDAAGR